MPTSLQQGINAAKTGQMDEALKHLKDAIIEEPQNADVWVWIAAIIDDFDKQEIFLTKALEIDPQNIPAQRGMTYLQQRKQQPNPAKDEHLSDHTQPISPFPAPNKNHQRERTASEVQVDSNELLNLTVKTSQDSRSKETDMLPEKIRLTTFEIILLSVVVIVFAFIGLLASSAIFNFDLPWNFRSANRPKLSAEPPYPGVFLYENNIYFNMQQHAGPPVSDSGIPISTSSEPVIVFWQSSSAVDDIKWIYESGEYIAYQMFQTGDQANVLQPESNLQNGLYCLQEYQQASASKPDFFYCFRISIAEGE